MAGVYLVYSALLTAIYFPREIDDFKDGLLFFLHMTGSAETGQRVRGSSSHGGVPAMRWASSGSSFSIRSFIAQATRR